jgi:hypothetical protein
MNWEPVESKTPTALPLMEGENGVDTIFTHYGERRLMKPGFNAPDEYFAYYGLEYLA